MQHHYQVVYNDRQLYLVKDFTNFSLHKQIIIGTILSLILHGTLES